MCALLWLKSINPLDIAVFILRTIAGNERSFAQQVGRFQHPADRINLIAGVLKPQPEQQLAGCQVLRMVAGEEFVAPSCPNPYWMTADAASNASPRPQNSGRRWKPSSGNPGFHGRRPQTPT